MQERATVILIVVLALPLMAYAVYRWFKAFNSPDGERYRKMRMQGPFVPLSADEIAQDAQRAKRR